MSDKDIIDTIAEAMQGNWPWAEHVAKKLRERYAIVEKATSSLGWWDCCEDDGDPPDHSVHGEESAAEYVVTTWVDHPGEVQISYQGEPTEPISPTDARSFAAALLAAAEEAEPLTTPLDGYCTCYPEKGGRTADCGIKAHRLAAKEADQ